MAFIDDFADSYISCSDSKVTVNTIKDMLAGLSEFQEGKNAYTLHLNMAQECMKYFQERKLIEVSAVEQVRGRQSTPSTMFLLTRNRLFPPAWMKTTRSRKTLPISSSGFWMTTPSFLLTA